MKPIATYQLSSIIALTAAYKRAEHQMKADPDNLYELVLRQHKGSRSIRQNALIWLWCTELQDTDINEIAGHDKQWWYDEFKLKHEVPILERDEGANFDREREIYAEQTDPDKKELVRKMFADSLHVSDMNVTQTSEAMEAFMQYAVNMGQLLTAPEPDTL